MKFDKISEEVERFEIHLRDGIPSDLQDVLDSLDVLTVLHRARGLVAVYAPGLVAAALRAGVPGRALSGRPYDRTVVAEIRRRHGIAPERPGPRPVQRH